MRAAAELALLLPVLTFVFIVAIDFCRLFYAYNVITNCARNGALWQSDPHCQRHGHSQPVTLREPTRPRPLADANYLNPALTSSNIASSTGTDGQGNATAIVTVNYQFNMVSSYLGIW